ncbi:hypothetical protein JVT61DRAFT_13281 [Boletus reticuloceps]|uniref:Uncharacterized protein n=1 Tax=Boletus reticuloceps TaxID=495285 RepID=A0A8I2YVL7_9AGAM|nr:hypothetical protein JVT61DRAFT_13281 [Boletus reticuloceps]
MATATSISPLDSTGTGTDAEKYARIVKIRIRNMVDFKRIQDTKVVVPARTISNPSPLKKTASNRHPGQTHTRTEIDGAMNHELANARLLMHDLADHVFGHIVSTELAGDILQKFVQDRVVQVFETGSHNFKVPLDSKSDDAQSAIQQALEHADRYDCIQVDTHSDAEEPEGPSTNTNAKGKQKAKTYSFGWTKFPTEPLLEDKLVSFLNDITDQAAPSLHGSRGQTSRCATIV